MANIVFDTSAKGTLSPLSYTVGAGVGALLCVDVISSVGNPSGVTYNGVSMTEIFNGADSGGNRTLSSWYLYNPIQSSAQNIVVSGATVFEIIAHSYLNTGLIPITNFSFQAPSSGSSLVSTLTNVNSNSWNVVALWTGGSSPTAGTGVTLRQTVSGNFVGDSNGTVGSGTYSMTVTWSGGSQTFVSVQYEIQPQVPDPVNVSDTTAVTDVVKISLAKPFNVTDTTVMSDSAVVEISSLPITTDELAQLITSNYKWLTSTLLTAQQNYNVRPYFNVKILDDTVQPNSIINNGGTGFAPTTRSSSVIAPDGSLLAAGFDGSNHISFFKASNIHASAGVWDSQVTLYTGADILNNQNNVSINVSDWINGSYHIDVFFFSNFVNNSTNLNISQYYSDDGGVTWNNRTFTPSNIPGSNYFPPLNLNLSITSFKPRLINGTLNYGCAFIQPNGLSSQSNETYNIVYITNIGSFITWTRDIASNDWSIHTLSSFYFNNRDYIVFSGFRNFIDNPNTTSSNGIQNVNYSIWITSIISKTNSTSDIWSKEHLLFSAISPTSTNQNSFTYPMSSINNGIITIAFRAVTVLSVSQSAQGSTPQIVTTTVNYMLMNSIDARNFTYPSIVVYSDGTAFNDLNQTQNYNFYVNQGQYYYLLGSGKLWEFIQNNTLADVTNNVVSYSLQDVAGQASSITLQIANQNNIWYPNGTNSGASAISKNKKILLQQGYYNASGITETVPRSTYYIDDIQANVTSNSNDFTLTGRDIYKKFQTLITKYSYTYNGPFMYTDVFDGSTLSNWSQNSGATWKESTNTMIPTSIPLNDANIILSNVPTPSYTSLMAITFKSPISGTLYFYGFYINDTTYLRLEIAGDGMGNHTWNVEQSVTAIDGTVTKQSLDSGTISLSNTDTYALIVRRYDYYKFNFIISRVGDGNALDAYSGGSSNNFLFTSGSIPPNSTFAGEYDLTIIIPFISSQTWSVGFGCAGVVGIFSFFKYMQYNDSNNILELVTFLGNISGVNSYSFQDFYIEYFINMSSYTGTFTTPNNTLSILASQKVLNQNNSTTISNGEIKFIAKGIPTNSANPYGFSLVFRSDAVGNEYYWHVYASATGGYIASRFERLYSSTVYQFSLNANDCSNGSTLNNLYFDITQNHTYKIVMVDGWMMAFIDDVMVNLWNDNNTTIPYLTTGYWGWKTDSNTKLIVSSMNATNFWKQVSSFALNPGDDILSAITSILQTVRGWVFSNLLSIAKVIFLNSTDASTYTYQNQIYAQGVDNSDKEYVSQVTVYGNGVSAVAQNTTLMVGVSVREEVIVDYTLLTQEDAQNRANFELIHANQYQNQYNPKQTMNVGSELFDVVTVTNTGNNSSGVNSPTRVYAQKFTTGGSNNEYSQEVDSGNL